MLSTPYDKLPNDGGYGGVRVATNDYDAATYHKESGIVSSKSITSEQDASTYTSKQTNISADVEVPIVGVGGANGNLSVNQQIINSNYQSVHEQSGLYAGSGGFNVNVNGHTQLNAGAIVSDAPKDQNTFTTGSLGITQLDNTSQYKASNSGIGINTGSLMDIAKGALMAQIPQALNGKESDSSTTQSAISPANITIGGKAATAEQLKDVATTANANSLTNSFDLQKVQDQMALASTMGDIGALTTNVVSTAMQREAYVAKDHAMADAESRLTPVQLAAYNDPKQTPNKEAYLQAIAMSPENVSAAMENHPDLAAKYAAATTEASKQAVMNDLARSGALGDLAQANQQFIDTQNHYGPGSDFSRTAQALSGLAAGLASGNNGQALSNLTQPFLASAIGTYFDKLEQNPDGTINHQTDTTAERLLAHAAAGAVVAYMSGNNAASGATGAVSGEALAIIVHQQMYDNKPTDQLTTAEKENIRAVATLASGLAGALQGGSFETAATSAAAGYNAAVNNDTREQGAYDAPNFNWKDKFEIETKIKINQANALKDKIVDTKVQVEGSGNLGMGAHAHGSVKATVGINHGITVDEVEAGVGAGAALKIKLGGAVVEGTPKAPSAESDIKPNIPLWEKPTGSEQRENTISVGTKAAIEGDLLIFHGEASATAGVDSKVGKNGDTSTYAGGKAEIGAKPQIGAGAAAYVDIFNWKYTGDKKDGE